MCNTYMEKNIKKTHLQIFLYYHKENTSVIITQFQKWDMACTHSPPAHFFFLPNKHNDNTNFYYYPLVLFLLSFTP